MVTLVMVRRLQEIVNTTHVPLSEYFFRVNVDRLSVFRSCSIPRPIFFSMSTIMPWYTISSCL